jgi:DNA-binding phage protein
MGIQVVRNLLGGGTRQERKIKIKSLELAQVEKVSVLRSGISSLLFSLDSIKTRRDAARIAEAAHVKRVTLYETTYKFGDGSTETMLNLWSAADSFKQTIGQFEIEAVELRRKLIEIVSPAQIERSQM